MEDAAAFLKLSTARLTKARMLSVYQCCW